MARERIIEGTWSCRSCGLQGIKGRHKSCPGCGSPREASGGESKFDFGETTASGGLAGTSVMDPEALAAASAGADWFCDYCGASNRGDHGQCRTCSAAREEARPPADGAPAAVLPMASPAAARRWRWSRLLLFGCVTPFVVVLTGFCGYIFWAIQTTDYPGTVTKVAWSRTAQRETFTRVQKQGWQDQLRPAAAVMPREGRGESAGVERIRDCRTKQRGTRQVADGTRRVCTTRTRSVACGTDERCHVEDLGNGFAREVCNDVTRYCDERYEDCRDETRYRTEPVYGEECTYETWEWLRSGESTLSGSDAPPRWAELVTGPHDRIVRKESYQVELEYERKGERRRVSHHPTTDAEFDRWRPGTAAVLVVENDGTLKGFRDGDTVRPADARRGQ